ncbi:MAG TPA: YciI family protein [Polyangiaceae bacterium]|nr:YciI family protein [Polyangiaceae bacterium]
MFIVLLEFADQRAQAAKFMDGHREWIQRGFDEGVFLLAGSLQPGRGGTIVAHATTRAELQRRVDADPFVIERVVSAQIHEVAPSKVDERLQFLLGGAA